MIFMIEILQEAAHEAGETLLSYFRKELVPSQKHSSHQNLVTKADLASQEIVKTKIIDLMKKNGYAPDDIGFIGEENLSTPGKHTFIIDPLDGTNNFASGHDYFGISIAYIKDGVLTAGLIYQPTTRTSYVAHLGKGSYKVQGEKKEQMKISYTHVKDSILLSYMSSRNETRIEWLPVVTRLHEASRGLRILGSLALDAMHFSDKINNCNIVINAHAYLWDIAAAKLIVEEAGGSFTDWQGNPITFNLVDPAMGYRILICHPNNRQEILSLIHNT